MHTLSHAIDLAETWIKTKKHRQDTFLFENNVSQLKGRWGYRIGITSALIQAEKPNETFIPAITEDKLVFVYGWPLTKTITAEQLVSEDRQYQVRATTIIGDEEESEWYDEEETALQLQKQADDYDDRYVSTEVIKRIKELAVDEDEENDEIMSLEKGLEEPPPPEPEPEPEEEEPEEEEESKPNPEEEDDSEEEEESEEEKEKKSEE